MSDIFWIDPDKLDFPDVNLALEQPNGLLAVGGDLRPERLIASYRNGVFPWFEAGQPILWWSPDPRSVVYPNQFRPSRSLRKVLKKSGFTITFDRRFAAVIQACSEARDDKANAANNNAANDNAVNDNTAGTWITEEMKQAYITLHTQGIAHSVECWDKGELVGGLYGIALGSVFFGESMFSRRNNASKVAFCALINRLLHCGFSLIDCQVHSPHLASLGAIEIPRKQFSAHLIDEIDTSTLSLWKAVEMNDQPMSASALVSSFSAPSINSD